MSSAVSTPQGGASSSVVTPGMLIGVTVVNLIVIVIVVATLLAAWPTPGKVPPTVVVANPAGTGAPTVPTATPAPTTPPPQQTTRDPNAWPPGEGLPEVAITESDHLTVVYVPRLNANSPFAEQWRQAPYFNVPLVAQQMAMPMNPKCEIDGVKLQGLYDGRDIAWRVSWHDTTVDGNVDVGRFSDAVAIGFPLDEGAPPTMGAANLRVQILYWKALWQKDIEVGFQDVQDLHPNYWADLYWFAEGQFPYPVPSAFQLPASRQWFIAHQAGNPMAAFSRSQPVEELVAEGFSTLTHQPQSVTSGRGAWANDTWSVVFVRPLKTTDPLDYTFVPGGKGQIVCAAWQGSAGNRGGRKQWSNWSDFQLQPSQP